MNKNSIRRGLLPYLFLVLIVFSVYYLFNVLNQKVNVLTYDKFISSLNDREVETITVTPRDRAKIYEITGKLDDYQENEKISILIQTYQIKKMKYNGCE